MAHVELKTLCMDIDGLVLDYPPVRRLAEQRVVQVLGEPMLIAWYDGRRNVKID